MWLLYNSSGKQLADHEEVGRRDWQPTHTVLIRPSLKRQGSGTGHRAGLIRQSLVLQGHSPDYSPFTNEDTRAQKVNSM